MRSIWQPCLSASFVGAGMGGDGNDDADTSKEREDVDVRDEGRRRFEPSKVHLQ